MDQARVDSLGAQPIAPELAAIRAAKTRAALGALMGRHARDFEPTAFDFGIDVDPKDVGHYVLFLGQAGLGLPDRDYYLQASFAAKKAAYQAYFGKAARPHRLARPEGQGRRHRRPGDQHRRGQLDEGPGARRRRDL